jgi:polysaccharide pyruvyl transferase WcaK-like protein
MNTLLKAMPQAALASGRISILPRGLNAAQLKDVIRRCDGFMGARTHATVAALSQRVPTTSIAYSVKAKGINQDLFGHTRYVLETPCVTAASLRQHFDLLQAEAEQIRSLLDARLPNWRAKARVSAERLASLVSIN